MSKNRMHGQCQVLHDIETMSDAQLEEQYGIDIGEDGTVWDACENQEFSNITEWGQYMADIEEEENYSTTTKLSGNKTWFDDDRF